MHSIIINMILHLFAEWGNTYRCPNKKSFVDALDTLIAEGGRDCPELTFNGIIDAIEKGDPYPGSPMFVFTDAALKKEMDRNTLSIMHVA